MRLSLPILLFAMASVPAAAQAPAESPFIALLKRADAGRTGYVMRTDVDAPLADYQREKADAAEKAWTRLTRFMKLPDTTAEVRFGDLADATLGMLKEADGDGDGAVTAKEIEAYAARETDPVRRDGIRELLAKVDVDHDGTVSAEELKAPVDEERRKVVLARADYIGQAGATARWQRESIDKLFSIYAGPDGRLRIEDLAQALRAAQAAKK